MHRCYVVVVCALHAMKPKDAQDNLKRQVVLFLISDYIFVAALHFMLDVVGVCAGMSQTMQLPRRCVAIEHLTIDRCIEAMDTAERWESEGWGGFQRVFDASTPVPRFLGVHVHNTEAGFPSQASHFFQQLKCSLHTRFRDTVAKATRFFDFFFASCGRHGFGKLCK